MSQQFLPRSGFGPVEKREETEPLFARSGLVCRGVEVTTEHS